jgi:thiamine-monophosphate kinase
MLSEFDLIARYFTRTAQDARIILGVGDDCALVAPSPGMQLAVSTDMLVAGRHFFPDAEPRRLGHKCLAVNLSDLAAMGAKPLAFTLALALPAAEPAWLAPFAEGMLDLADRHGCELIGGDTTRGPLTISITVFGEVPPGLALRRDAARPGDDLWVSGTLGDARLALAGYRGETAVSQDLLELAGERMHAPVPRVELGIALRGLARAAIDVSDGLAGDLGHILQRSRVGATINVDSLPCGTVLARQAEGLRRQFALSGGDDYELCFTAPAHLRQEVAAAAGLAGVGVTRIGSIDTEPGLRLQGDDGAPVPLSLSSFDHFATP